jgi:hypothetical protein
VRRSPDWMTVCLKRGTWRVLSTCAQLRTGRLTSYMVGETGCQIW